MGYPKTTGLTRGIGSFDSIITLGGFPDPQHVGTTEEQAGTFMHELGHQFGLHHGGTDEVLNKPNYLSVMNPLFQFDGFGRDGNPVTFDYSRFALDLDELHLNRQGLTSDKALAGYASRFYCDCKDQLTEDILSLTGPVTDWSCAWASSKSVGNLRHDMNGSCTEETLRGAEDWSRISLAPALKAPGVPTTPVVENDLDTAQRVAIAPVAGVNAVFASAGAVDVSWKGIPLDRVIAYRVWRGLRAGESFGVVGTTDATSFRDPDGGTNSAFLYRVTALLVNRGGTRVQLSAAERNALAERARNRLRKWTLMGSISSEGPTPAVPEVLYETRPSTSARIVERLPST